MEILKACFNRMLNIRVCQITLCQYVRMQNDRIDRISNKRLVFQVVKEKKA